MTPDQFLANFGHFLQSQNSISRLRQAVFEVAVSGGLVPQVQSDASSSGLIEELIKRKKHEPSCVAKNLNDGPFALPRSWSWATLDQIADLRIGRTPSTKDPKYWESGDFAWVSIADMPKSGVIEKTAKRVSSLAAEEIFRAPPAPIGTLLMSFKLSIGKLCTLKEPSYFNEAIVAIDPPIAELRPYLSVCLRGIDLIGTAVGAIKGKTLNKAKLKALRIPVPPLLEQARIIAKVNELMALCDELEAEKNQAAVIRRRFQTAALDRLAKAETSEDLAATCQRVTSNFSEISCDLKGVENLRKTILNLAVRGQLVTQDEKEGSAKKLFELIVDEKSRLTSGGRIPKQKILPPVGSADTLRPPQLPLRLRPSCLFAASSGSKNTLDLISRRG